VLGLDLSRRPSPSGRGPGPIGYAYVTV